MIFYLFLSLLNQFTKSDNSELLIIIDAAKKIEDVNK